MYRTPTCYYYLNSLILHKIAKNNNNSNEEIKKDVDRLKDMTWKFLQEYADVTNYSQLTEAAICYISTVAHENKASKEGQELKEFLKEAKTKVLGLVKNTHKRVLLKQELDMFDK